MLGARVRSEELYAIPLAGKVVRPGTDATIVAYGRMVSEAETAAEELAAEGIECEIIDPRTLQPLDMDTIVASARERTGLWSSMRRCASAGSADESRPDPRRRSTLPGRCRVGRIAAPFSPVPFSPGGRVPPDPAKIAAGVRATLARPGLPVG